MFRGSPSFTHAQADKIGVLITNLGTPEAPTKQALRPYLKQFLSDPRVVEFPRLLWKLILNLIILNIRPARSAKAYQQVWSEDGSPLLVYTRKQADALRASLEKQYGEGYRCGLCDALWPAFSVFYHRRYAAKRRPQAFGFTALSSILRVDDSINLRCSGRGFH